MTDSDESPEIEEVRRLLAQARHSDPMPDDVAARMDDLLTELSDDHRARPSPAADVIPLSPRRRRRAAGLLVAAAAIVVGGVVTAQQLPRGFSGGAASSAGGRVTSEAGQNDRGNTGNAQAPSHRLPTTTPTPMLRHGRLVVRPGHFASDALAGRTLLRAENGNTAKYDFNDASSCVRRPARAKSIDVTYRHAPAKLVYRRAAGSTQVVDLFVCGRSRPIRSATLPAP